MKQPSTTRKQILASHTGPWLREARIAHGWSQRQLAQAIGKSQQWIAAIELGTRKIRQEDARTLRTALALLGEEL